ncbi:hypothetical protein [Thiobacillus sp.]|uniref:hypothetical protein n=1 Tax=Thiobacillus sp. TaxID=924 RepID=UPI0017D4BAAD|nr:hypothetical protein [Thiobacillus sp.]MBC2731394.1 hypothetical protein [Thiobacillus sp.]MBC2740131.1 hypothetical protein [Thiobacillus sp.]MBC2758343.1 hypothetical protein [Thiobacillus sp.]
MMARLKLLLLSAIALIAAAAFGWWMGQPKPVQETAAPEQRQADGSLKLERQPDAQAKPKQRIPPKAKVERLSRVTVQPAAIAEAGKPCPPVTVDMTLVRESDGGRRVLASSPDGQVVGGLDIPVETAAPPPEPKRWAAGVSWAPADSTAGVWIERDVPVFNQVVRAGIEVNQVRVDTFATGIEGRLKLGLAF